MDNNQKPSNKLNKQNMNNNIFNTNNANNQELNIQRNKDIGVNSETIASFMIEKIISLAITGAFTNEIDSKISLKCYSYITNIINNYIKVEYLAFDRDDKNMVAPINKNKILKTTFESKKNFNTYNTNININNNEDFHNFSNLQNNFFNKSISNNENMNKIDLDSSLSVEENKKIVNEVTIENEFLKTNENNSNMNLEDNLVYYYDNYILGVNDWTICDEPVNKII
jgi:hypothetical protein